MSSSPRVRQAAPVAGALFVGVVSAARASHARAMSTMQMWPAAAWTFPRCSMSSTLTSPRPLRTTFTGERERERGRGRGRERKREREPPSWLAPAGPRLRSAALFL